MVKAVCSVYPHGKPLAHTGTQVPSFGDSWLSGTKGYMAIDRLQSESEYGFLPATGTISPAYSPSSPTYSATSPAYSPISPANLHTTRLSRLSQDSYTINSSPNSSDSNRRMRDNSKQNSTVCGPSSGLYEEGRYTMHQQQQQQQRQPLTYSGSCLV